MQPRTRRPAHPTPPIAALSSNSVRSSQASGSGGTKSGVRHHDCVAGPRRLSPFGDAVNPYLEAPTKASLLSTAPKGDSRLDAAAHRLLRRRVTNRLPGAEATTPPASDESAATSEYRSRP